MTQPTYSDYMKAAFNLNVAVPQLGELPLNKMFLGVFLALGFISPAFWFLGLALELIYLTALAGNERFQRVVKVQHEKKQKALEEQNAPDLTRLDTASRDRYQRLGGVCNEILSMFDQNSLERSELLNAGGITQLLEMFLKLLKARQRIQSILSKTRLTDIDYDCENLTKKLNAESEDTAIAKSLRSSLEIQQKRKENLLKAKENLSLIDLELDRIERQLSLIKEEVAVTSDPSILTFKLDSAMESLKSTATWMADHSELFNMAEEPSLATAPRGREKQKQSQ